METPDIRDTLNMLTDAIVTHPLWNTSGQKRTCVRETIEQNREYIPLGIPVDMCYDALFIYAMWHVNANVTNAIAQEANSILEQFIDYWREYYRYEPDRIPLNCCAGSFIAEQEKSNCTEFSEDQLFAFVEKINATDFAALDHLATHM